MDDKPNTTTYEVEVPVTVTITVVNEPVGAEPKMHPLDPRRMEGIYELEDPREMLTHLAYNAIRNHKECASGLDGWGDISVAIGVEGFDEWPKWKRMAYVRDNHPVQMQVTDVELGDADLWGTKPPTTAEVQTPRP